MLDRRHLTLALAGTSSVVVALVLWPLLRSLSPSDRAINDGEFIVRIEPIVEGKLQVVPVNNFPLFVLRPSAKQREAITSLDPYVFDKAHSYYSPALDAYVYWGVSTKWGCPLSERTTEDRQAFWPEAPNLWPGGYWGGHCEVSYDYAGRTVADSARSFNGYAARWPNLDSPRIKVSGLNITVYPYDR
jgi:Rieske Fe-S protein